MTTVPSHGAVHADADRWCAGASLHVDLPHGPEEYRTPAIPPWV